MITHNEATLVALTKAAIEAVNNLVMFAKDHQGLISDGAFQTLVEADYLLNSFEDTFVSDEQVCIDGRRGGSTRTGGATTVSWSSEQDRLEAVQEGVDPLILAHCEDADHDAVALTLAAPVDGPDDYDGRSPFMWVRFPNGDLMLGVFPHGDTYFATEEGRGV